MDYEKAYKEALGRAREFQKSKDGLCVLTAESIFPELQESEDERIRKVLIDYFNRYKEQEECGVKTFYGIPTDNILAWLEKQGEQKPTDKVEPFDKCEGLTDFERTLADICIGWIGEEHGWKQYIKDNADALLKIAIKKFNQVQDAPFEQKPAWSEEDEEYMSDVIAFLKDARDCRQNALDCIEWMKQLKERLS